MFPDVDRVLIHRDEIARRVDELAARIVTDLRAETAGEEEPRIVLVPILTGSIVFLADLIRRLPLKFRIDVVAVSSYPGKSVESKGVKIRSELPTNLRGAHVLVVDDILDSGQTLQIVRDLIREQRPASLRLCVALEKQMPEEERRITADYVGFSIPNLFVVGYGLDFNGFYRNHPDVVTLKRDAMQ